MAPLLAMLGMGAGADAAAGAAAGGLGGAGAGAGLGAGAAGAAAPAAAAAGGLGSATGGSFLSDILGPVMKGLGGGGAPPLDTAAPLGPGGTGAGTGSGMGPLLPSTPTPSVGESLQIPGLTGQMGASPTTPMSPMGTGSLPGPPPGGGGGSPGILSQIGSGLSNAASSFFQPPQGGSIWQSPFGQYLLQRHGIGSQPGQGQNGQMNPMLQAALLSGLGKMVQPAYSASGMGNPFTFNPMGAQFQ
jgi:hypothetical protein